MSCSKFPEALMDSITCSVCSEIFTDPVELKCRHTFCRGCVDARTEPKNRKLKVVCPTCRSLTTVKAQDELPDDTRSVCLVDLYQLQKPRPARSPPHTTLADAEVTEVCQLCKGSPSVAYCFSCNSSLCRGCEMTHTAIPDCNTHVMRSVQDLYEEARAQLKGDCAALRARHTALDQERRQRNEELKSERDNLLTQVRQIYKIGSIS